MQKGKASIIFEEPPCIYSAAAIVGQKEGEGPLGACFDQVEADPMFGQANWEAAESELQRRTALCNMEKSGISREKIRYLFGGDLLGQIVATSFGVSELEIPLFGLYGACSTMGEALSLSAMTVALPTASWLWRPAILPARRGSFGFHWPMEIRGRFLLHGQ